MKTIRVIADSATEKDIKDFVDVEYGEVNSMKIDNPCCGDACEIIHAEWEAV